MIIINSRNKTDVTDGALYQLAKESYQQWIDQGLECHWLHRSAEDFYRMIQHAAIVVAHDADTGEVLGMHCFRANNKLMRVYGFYLAVSPKAKHQGVATRMLHFAVERFRQAGFRYIKETTATTAEWSVRWHLKNGYRIIGYYHAPDDNFANYVFRKQLIPITFSSPSDIAFILRHPVYALYSCSFFCRLRFALAYAITRLTKDAHGHDNLLARLARKLLR